MQIPTWLSFVTPFVTLGIGIALGHWLQLGRDKRKELNEAAQPVRTWVIHQLSDRTKDLTNLPDESVVDAFSSRLPPKERDEFNRTWRRMLGHFQRARVINNGITTFNGTIQGQVCLRTVRRLTHPR